MCIVNWHVSKKRDYRPLPLREIVVNTWKACPR
jgi:hypothetical protein